MLWDEERASCGDDIIFALMPQTVFQVQSGANATAIQIYKERIFVASGRQVRSWEAAVSI